MCKPRAYIAGPLGTSLFAKLDELCKAEPGFVAGCTPNASEIALVESLCKPDELVHAKAQDAESTTPLKTGVRCKQRRRAKASLPEPHAITQAVTVWPSPPVKAEEKRPAATRSIVPVGSALARPIVLFGLQQDSHGEMRLMAFPMMRPMQHMQSVSVK